MTDMLRKNHPVTRRQSLTACLRGLIITVLLFGGMTAAAPHAEAQSLDAARASGMIGERLDGYAEARPNATSAVRTLVANVNAQRQKIYTQRAREQNISAEAVGKLYAAQIIANAPKGTWVQQSSGGWTQK